MAFIGVLLLSLIFLVLFLAVVCGIIFLIGLGLVSLIGGIILTVTGTAVTAKSKKKMLGIQKKLILINK